MTLETLVQLARSRTPADRNRVQLATAALGLSGALLLAALRIARLGDAELSKAVYSNYVAESGLRSGLVAILIILAVLTGGLAVQALRLGTAARERRLAALRLAGASRKQVRQLSVTDAALVGLAGGLVAGPLYLVLSLLFGLLPRMAQVLPGAEPLDLVTWIPVVAMTTAAGALIGSLLHRDQLLPSGDRPEPVRTGIIAGPVMILLGLFTVRWIGYVASTVFVIGLALFFVSLAPLWIQAVGRRFKRSGDPASLLTGVHLVTDARPAGRMATLLACCAFLIGSLASGTIGVITAGEDLAEQPAFYVTGFALGSVGVLLVVLTGLAALVVGVADQLVDQRRQLACLTALGVDARFLRRVIRRQLTAVAAPALAGGLLLGTLLGVGRLVGGAADPFRVSTLITAAGLTAAGWLLGLLGGIVAGFLLRNQLHDALDPENLRAA
ncbi:FtsX-like permease family protein [Kribbella swartbergensis]